MQGTVFNLRFVERTGIIPLVGTFRGLQSMGNGPELFVNNKGNAGLGWKEKQDSEKKIVKTQTEARPDKPDEMPPIDFFSKRGGKLVFAGKG